MEDLSKTQVLANKLEDYRKNLPLPDNDGVVKFDVLCKDGTTKSQSSSPNAEILDACRDNGGKVNNQPFVKQLQALRLSFK